VELLYEVVVIEDFVCKLLFSGSNDTIHSNTDKRLECVLQYYIPDEQND